jgi:DMSO reductase family type II enzyme heme b subunit
MYNDVTPEGLMGDANALVFYPGVFAGNSMSARERKSPIEELTASGFGSLTTHEQQAANGRGVNDHGHWRVVIAMPMDSGDATKARVRVGANIPVAFAVWSGEKKNRGARKQYANWVPMEVEA